MTLLNVLSVTISIFKSYDSSPLIEIPAICLAFQYRVFVTATFIFLHSVLVVSEPRLFFFPRSLRTSRISKDNGNSGRHADDSYFFRG